MPRAARKKEWPYRVVGQGEGVGKKRRKGGGGCTGRRKKSEGSRILKLMNSGELNENLLNTA